MEHEVFRMIAEGHERMALATIIDVKGSSPRHPGTRMLLRAETGRLGTIGGGEGEARALQECRISLEDGRPALLRIEMFGMYVDGPEMICGGTHTILIEPLDTLVGLYRTAKERLAMGERVLFLKRIHPRLDGSLTVDVALLDQTGTPIQGAMDATMALPVARALGTGQPYFDEQSSVYYEPVFPEEKLLILGAGHVGRALAAAAPPLGFRVTVVDDRPEILAEWTNPDGVRPLLADFGPAIAEFPFDSATYVVVVTRGHLCDLECLRALLKREYRYAGFMGSARKARFLIEQLLQDGFEPAKVDALWGPIGLDIGAETPEELANATLSEMIAVRRNAKLLPQLKQARRARRAVAKAAVRGTQCA